MNFKKILVVDDSATDRYHLNSLLSVRPYAVMEAENGQQALDLALQNPPDLILMDVVMPELNGFQVTRQFSKHEQLKHIPIVLCTSKDAETDKLWGLRQGAKAYLVKPIQPEQLYKTISALETIQASLINPSPQTVLANLPQT